MPHDHKTFENEFCTPTPKLFNYNKVMFYVIQGSGWLFSNSCLKVLQQLRSVISFSSFF